MLKHKRGFTLIELLAVVVILAVIVVIALPAILGVVKDFSTNAFKADGNLILKQIEQKELYDNNFKASDIKSIDDLNNLLKLNTDNYESVTATNVNGKPYISIKGKNKWAGLEICGTLANLIAGNIGVCTENITAIIGDSAKEYFYTVNASSTSDYIVVGEDYENGDALIKKYDSSGNLLWEKNFGGSSYDGFFDSIIVNDGYIAVGNSNSSDGDLAGMNYGDADAIIVKYDLNGDVVWQNHFGGDSYDNFDNVVATSDGYIITGSSNSNTNDLTGMNYGNADAIIVKYDLSGNIVWKNNFGGNNEEYINDVIILSDGYILNINSSSTTDDLSGMNYGITDALIIKLDLTGNLVWKKHFGGSQADNIFNLVATTDGYIAIGRSASGDNDLAGMNHGNQDAIIIKYDLNGDVVWKKNFGGYYDDSFYNVIASADGYIVTGDSKSDDADLSGISYGNGDAILVKYDLDGNIVWKKTFGGHNEEYFSEIESTSNGYIVAGESYSTDNDMEGLNHGTNDAIIVKYDLAGNVIWKKTYGYAGSDYYNGLIKNGNNYAIIINSEIPIPEPDPIPSNFTIFDPGFGNTYYTSSVSNSDSNVVIGNKNNEVNYVAEIIKYDLNRNVIWQKQFGGSNSEYFTHIIKDETNYIVVGQSNSTDGDLAGMNWGSGDGIIVKYDSNGNVIWKKNFGGTGSDDFNSVINVSDGYVAVGNSYSTDGDLTGLNHQSGNVIIVKYDFNGNMVWKKTFGGNELGSTSVSSVNSSPNGFIVAGTSSSTDGDLAGLNKGLDDALIVKFDLNGNVVWKKTFGGTSSDWFSSIINVSDGYVAVGRAYSNDIDLEELNNGNADSIIVKYDLNGNIVWKKNYGGSSWDNYNDIVAVEDGYWVVGMSNSNDGDLTNMNHTSCDGIVVKYDNNGQLISKYNYDDNDGNSAFWRITYGPNGPIIIAGSPPG